MIVDQAQALAGGMQLVPDFGAIQARNQQLELQRMAIEQRQQEQKQAFLQMQRQQDMQMRWQQRVAQLQANPSPEAIRATMLEFPEMRETLSAAFQDVGAGDLRQIGAIYSYLEQGDNQGAISVLEQRIAADTAAGRPDPEDQAMLAVLRSNDREAINRARAGLGVLIAAHPRGEDFVGNLTKLRGGAAGERTPTWRAGQDAYDDAIRRGATPAEAEARRNYVVDALERNATNPLITAQPGGMVSTTEFFRRQVEGGGPASSGGGGNPAPAASVDQIGADAEQTGTITQQGADIVRSVLGPQAFNDWMTQNNVRIAEGQPQSQAPVTVRSVEQANALPRGTRYRTPDGREFIR